MLVHVGPDISDLSLKRSESRIAHVGNGHDLALEVGLVQLADDSLGVLGGHHFNETETSRFL